MRIVFIGAGGHGKVCAEIAELAGYSDILFLDDDRKLNACGKYKTVGTVSDYLEFVEPSTGFFVSVGNAEIRRRIQGKIENSGGVIVTLLHPGAVISMDASIGAGTVIMAGAVVNAGAGIGKGVIVNTSSSVDHDCKVCDYCHIAVGAHLCGGVTVGEGSWVGAGAVINNNICICGGCMVGAGAVVVKDIREDGTYLGVPAKRKVLDESINFGKSSVGTL